MVTATDRDNARAVLTTIFQVLTESDDELSQSLITQVIAAIDREREAELDLLRMIVGSEAFMWLMVGPNHPEAHRQALRPAWQTWQDTYGPAKSNS